MVVRVIGIPAPSGRGPVAGRRKPPAKAGRTTESLSLGSVCAHILLCVCTHHIPSMCSVGSMNDMLCAPRVRDPEPGEPAQSFNSLFI
eukprot:SAG31_NODE_2209_length_6183_cov_6.782544_2_plen_88_part_00